MTMSKVSVVGTVNCRDGEAAEMEAVLTTMVDAARHEPGVEVYSYHRGEGNAFWFFALMSDEAAMQHHGRSEAMQAAMQAFAHLMAEPPQMSVTRPIAAVGLDL
jgi:quinol monooxygenase YgiN